MFALKQVISKCYLLIGCYGLRLLDKLSAIYYITPLVSKY